MQQAIFHTRMSVFTRSKGHKAIQKAAYRAGEKYYDERNNTIFNYSYKKGKDWIQSEIILPEGASEKLTDRQFLYNEIEKMEKRGDAQLVREIEFSLYRDLTIEQNKELAREFARTFVEQGMAADLNFHKLNQNNPHCHMTLTMRPIDKKTGLFSKSKTEFRKFNDKKLSKDWRQTYSDLVNKKFKELRIEKFVDPRTYKEQGIEKIPQLHLPVAGGKNKEEIIELNNIIRKHNYKTELEDKRKDVENTTNIEKVNYNVKKNIITDSMERDKDKNFIEKEVKKRMAEQLGNQLEIDELLKKFEAFLKENDKSKSKTEEKKKEKEPQTLESLFELEVENYRNRYENYKNQERIMKEKVLEKRASLIEYKEQYREQKQNRTLKIEDSKLRIEGLKASLKSTSRFSLSDMKKRREIKEEIAKEKVAQKRQKLAQKREKIQMKNQQRDYRKSRLETLKLTKNKVLSYVQTQLKNREMNKVKDLKKKIPENVVSLDEYRKNNRIEMKPSLLERVKAMGKNQSRAR